jgi:hypothetical protein
LHQAALGSVHSLDQWPITTNDVNVSGFFFRSGHVGGRSRMLVNGVASSSTELWKFAQGRDEIDELSYALQSMRWLSVFQKNAHGLNFHWFALF